MDNFCGSQLLEDTPPTELPSVSKCMQNTVLVWVPALFTLTFFPFLLSQARRVSKRFEPLPYSFLLILKIVLCSLLTAIYCYVSFYNLGQAIYLADYLYPVLMVCSYGSMVAGHIVRKRCGMVTSGIQHVSALIFLIAGFPELYQRLRIGLHFGRHLPSLNILYYYYYGFLVMYSLLLCFADRRPSDHKTKQSPELDSSFLNRLTHWWFNPITLAGASKDLEIDDLFDLNPGTSTAILTNLWLNRWSQGEAWISVKRLFLMFKWEFLSASFFKLCADLLQFANPFLLRQMISFVTKDNSWWQGLGYAVLMFTLSEVRSLIQNYYIYIMMRLGVKVQTTLTAAVYRKTLLLSNSSRRNRTVGEIVNLMSIDVDVFYVTAAQIQQLWSTPLQITLVLTYLYLTLGYSAAVGILIMSFFIPFNLFTSVIVKNWQTEQMTLKDERAKMVNEVLNGIKVVKLYAWEKPMQDQIEAIRERELVLIKKGTLVKNLIDAFNASSPFLVALFTFSTFVLSDSSHQLTPQVAFVALTLFNLMRSNMNMVAFVINQGVQTLVSYKRLAAFFAADELDSSAVENTSDLENSAEMTEFSANWDLESEKRTLDDVSVTVPKGNLLVVVGRVGCGKSSLLSALLGEMSRLRGSIGVNGKLAYVPQQAWIQNLTVRDNILFGKPYNKHRYNQVLDACALRTDLEILTNGDLTEIGEKGINLSGGQKARISLARAVYQDFDIYLLDDPLSAVDSHVGKYIFEKVIGPSGLLKNKTRILVTHGLVYTKQADEIIVLDAGKIVERGTYPGLLKARGKLASFLEEYAMEKTEEEEQSTQSNGEEPEKDEERPRAETVSSPEIPKSEIDIQKLINKEAVGSGQVKFSVYKMYMKSASYWRSFIFFIFLISSMSFQLARSFWLSTWSNQYRSNETLVSPVPFIVAYAAFGLIESLSIMISFIFIVFAGLTASRNLHSPLIHSVMRSPMEFFDTTPLGRVLNRCTKDIEVVDFSLPSNFRLVTMSILQVLFTLIAIVLATPAFVVVIIPLATLYYFVLRFFVNTSRQLTRLQSTSRSPIFSHFGETLQGATSIRAFGKVKDFHLTAGQVVDCYIRCKYLDVVSTRWLAVRLEFIGNLVIFFAALFVVLAKEFDWTESPGTVGVSISYALSITDVLNLAVRHVSQVENSIVSVERIKEYSRIAAEAPWVIQSTRPGSDWSSSGVVTFDKYSTRYRAGLDLVLQEISANVSSGEKIGIVGRTGAGKSSFALALFRLIEPAEGEIIIDGVDVSKIGLHDLRSALTIIPQDPVLFSGTLRFNLDPFEKCSDQEIWHALELAHLKEMASSFEKGLSHHISEGGENISVGQRQLVCLARALLRRTRILVLDEATAAVDVATDALIQTTIREQFKDCTVFTIAHRLNTILDYDRIMVLDKGQIAEFDSPDTLLEDKNTIFSRMVADSKKIQ